MLFSEEADRDALTRQGLCLKEHPAVSIELYGSLSIRSGLARVALRADTIRGALSVLVLAQPTVARLLGPLDKLAEYHRFSINGRAITTDLDTPLKEGDRLVLFSASVGG